jgi:N-methylhydantoinase B
MATTDPITLGVVWGALQSVAVEIGSTIHRTAYSDQAREGQDFSVAVFDPQGRMICQGPYSPGHLGAMHHAVPNAISSFPEGALGPGDVVLLNDPSLGSGHFPDFFVTSPCYWQGNLIGYATNILHHTDVGGARPGSQAVEGVTDYHQEGLFIPPIKIVEGGVPVESAIRLIAANSRAPEDLRGDLQAQLNSLRIGEQRLASIVDTHGLDAYLATVDAILDRSEEAVRGAISQIPDGVYEFEDFMDDYGNDTPPIRCAVRIEVRGDSLHIDFAGTDPQTASGLNSYFNYTRSYTYMAVKCLTDPFGPMNAGVLRGIEVVCPEGTFLNPNPPAGGGPRAVICHRIFELIIGALAPAVPERVQAACSHFSNPTWGGFDPVKERLFVTYELLYGGTGARSTKDGVDGMSSPFNSTNIPVEAVESKQPLIIDQFAYVPDSAGPGRFRGGVATRLDVTVLGEDVVVSNLSERQKFPSYGLFGGEAGTLGLTLVNPDRPDERVVGGKESFEISYGDTIRFQLSGAGGYGNPMERLAEAVGRDVRLGLVSVEHARERYGVVVGTRGEVDLEGTRALRASERTVAAGEGSAE